MDIAKRKRLQSAGWRVGSAKEFLGLSDPEATFVDMKLRLAHAMMARRVAKKITQVQTAKLLGSSQSRIAKMEAGDASVSADLLIRALLALGATPKEVGELLGTGTSGGERRAPRGRSVGTRR